MRRSGQSIRQEDEYKEVLRRVDEFAEAEGRRPRILVRRLPTREGIFKPMDRTL